MSGVRSSYLLHALSCSGCLCDNAVGLALGRDIEKPRSVSVLSARQAAPRITPKKNNNRRPTQRRSVGQSTPSKGTTLRLLIGTFIWSSDVVWVTFVACFRTFREVSWLPKARRFIAQTKLKSLKTKDRKSVV